MQQYIYSKDLIQTVIPILPEDKQAEIEQKVLESFNLRKRAKDLLEHAKRAVEIAIEQDEQAAIDWLESVSEIAALHFFPYLPESGYRLWFDERLRNT